MMRTIISVVFCCLFVIVIYPNFVRSDVVSDSSFRQKALDICQKSVVRVERTEIGSSQKTVGTGILYAERRILTNAHVIGELPTSPYALKEILSDEDIVKALFWVVFRNEKRRASLVGRDPEIDLAILEIEEAIEGMIVAPLDDSDIAAIGHPVIACGNPLAMEGGVSVTEGIVSAREKKPGLLSYEDAIQTDAAVNPGNSGGPLISLERGAVIGIVNSGIPSADNMSFAIPVNLFKDVEPELVGTLRRSWIGLSFPFEGLKNAEGFSGILQFYEYTGIEDLSTLNKMRLEVFERGGVLVTDVKLAIEFDPRSGTANNPEAKSPAHTAGIKIGFIIKKFGEYDVRNNTDLIYAIFQSKPYQETLIRVVRFNEVGERIVADLAITPIIRLPKNISNGFY